MIVAVLAAATPEALLTTARAARPLLDPDRDAFELRLDALSRPEAFPAFDELAALGLPLIATARRVVDGGLWRGSESARRALLGGALSRGARWIDLEDDFPPSERPGDSARWILSRHLLEGLPDDLESRAAAARAAEPFAVKIAAQATSAAALQRLTRLTREGGGRVAAFALGCGGAATRWLADRLGAPLSYAHTEPPGAPAPAPGLPALTDLLTLFRDPQRRPAPRVLGVLAARPERSLGPLVWGRVLRRAGLSARYVPLGLESLDGLLPLMRTLGLDGLSVTIPHKEAALRLAEAASPMALEVGAANTLVREGDRLWADNTDVAGVLLPLQRALGGQGPVGPIAWIVGAGGAARAAVVAARHAGLVPRVVARGAERAARLREAFGIAAVVPDPEEVGLVVNATPVGGAEAPEDLPVPEELLRPGVVVLDMVYRPMETELLRVARARGAVPIPGGAMFAAQAWTQAACFLPEEQLPESAFTEAFAWASARSGWC